MIPLPIISDMNAFKSSASNKFSGNCVHRNRFEDNFLAETFDIGDYQAYYITRGATELAPGIVSAS